MLGSGGLCVHSGLGAPFAQPAPQTIDQTHIGVWRAVRAFWTGGALRFVLRVPACTIDYIYTRFVLASEKLRMRSGRGVRSLFGGVLCCVLRVPIRTMDYSKCLEGCAWVLGGVCVACLVVLYVAS